MVPNTHKTRLLKYRTIVLEPGYRTQQIYIYTHTVIYNVVKAVLGPKANNSGNYRV